MAEEDPSALVPWGPPGPGRPANWRLVVHPAGGVVYWLEPTGARCKPTPEEAAYWASVLARYRQGEAPCPPPP